MTATATPAGAATGTSSHPFGTLDLALADSRLAFLLGNEVKHLCMHRVFGVSRENENLVAAIVVLSAAGATYAGARLVLRAPMRAIGSEGVAGAFVVREAGIALAGPTVGTAPMFASLTAFALVAGIAVPTLRRAAHAARLAEQRVREHRIARYLAAGA
jgi:hypothetical protein